RYGLLDAVQIRHVVNLAQQLTHRGRTVGLVRIEPDRLAVCVLGNSTHRCRIRIDASRDLHLVGVEVARLDHALAHRLDRIDADRRTQRQFVVLRAAEQCAHGHAEDASRQVVQGDVDGILREREPARYRWAQLRLCARLEGLDLRRVHADDERCELATHDDLDRFDRLVAPARQSALLAPADAAIVGGDLHEEHVAGLMDIAHGSAPQHEAVCERNRDGEGFDADDLRQLGHPFTAPELRPAMNCFCMQRKMMSDGSSASTAPASTTPMPSVSSLRRLRSASGRVYCAESVATSSGNMYWSQIMLKPKIVMTPRPGRVSGKITFQNVRSSPAPSIRAASSSSIGT